MSEVRVPGAIIMGNVAIIVKIMPESPDVDREALKAAVKAAVPVDDIREEPIGFGLVALKAAVVVPDKAGAPDEVEAALQNLEGVASAEIIESTLV
ncbi:MAG: elongation factor 1-beta [Methanoculleus sp.]|nr:elongation factor 1-beta [Methanoculleus sp.]